MASHAEHGTAQGKQDDQDRYQKDFLTVCHADDPHDTALHGTGS